MTQPTARDTVLLRPIPLIALAVMLLNDHVLKTFAPSVLTGKLSDVTGLIVFPLLMMVAWAFVSGRAGRPVRDRRMALAVAIVATASVFAAIKLFQPATDLYAAAIGAGQWVGAVALGVATNTAIPGPWTVQVARDPTDLLALPALAVAWLEGTRGFHRAPTPRLPARNARTQGGLARSARARPTPLALAVLIIGAVASIANQPGPTPGVATTVESSVSVELAVGDDFAVRELTFTVGPDAGAQFLRRWVTVTTTHPSSVILVTRPDDGTGRRGGTWPPSPETALTLDSCQELPCVSRIGLIVRVDEPVSEATTIDVQLAGGVGTSEDTLVVPAHALRLTVEEGPGGRERVEVGEVSGEIRVDAEHPIVEQHVVMRRDPDIVADEDLVFVDTQVTFESDDVDEIEWVYVGDGRRPPSTSLTGDPVGWAVDSGPCQAAEPCEAAYPIQVVAGPLLTRPVTVRWRIVTRLVDYDTGARPVRRAVVGDRGEKRTTVDGSRSVDSMRGELVMTADQPWADVRIGVAFNDALAAFATAERPVTVSRRLTLVATDADGIGGEEGLIRVTPVTFDLDGQSHDVAFHALQWCAPEDCFDGVSFQMGYQGAPGPSVVACPITVRWTLEVRVAAFGDEPLPSDADFELVAE
jgi:hypothetical protein